MSGRTSPTPQAAASASNAPGPQGDNRFDGMTPTLRNILVEVFQIRNSGLLPHMIRALHYEGTTTAVDLFDHNRNWDRFPLGYPDPARSRDMIIVPPVYATKIRLLLAWARDKQATMQRALVESDWDAMDAAEFLELRNRTVREPQRFVIPPNPAQQRSGATTATDPDVLFRKGIRRDPQAFPALKDIRFFLGWHRKFLGQIHAQDLANIIDESYTPSTVTEDRLFILQKDYMYTVFLQTLLTDDTKKIVRDHESTRDAQAIYTDLRKFVKDSPDATIFVNELTQFLTTDKLDGRWRGTTKGYLTHWDQKMAQFEDVTPTSQHYSEDAKKRMLMNAVKPIKDLHQVQLQDELRVAADPATVRPLGYVQYRALLVARATRYDDELLQGAKTRRAASRAVQLADVAWGEYAPDPLRIHATESNYFDFGDQFHTTLLEADDAHTAIQPYDVYAAQQQRPRYSNRPWIPPEIWTMLQQHPELLTAWNQFDWNKAPANGAINNRRTSQRANLHDMTYEEFVGQVPSVPSADSEQRELYSMIQRAVADHVAGPSPSTTTDVRGVHSTEFASLSSPSPQAGTQLVAHMTKKQTKPSAVKGGNVRQLINQAHTSTATAGVQATPGGTVRLQGDDVDREVFMIDGKRFLQINMNKISYSISKLERRTASLMDRGANGGLLGSDARVIGYLDPDRTADVSGLADHTVSDLRIGTAAAVVQTQRGMVCIIMHQYAIYGKGKTIHSCGQWENFGVQVEDRSRTVGGRQRIITPDGYVIPLQIRNGLAYIDMRPPNDEELDTLPQVIVTADDFWNPAILDNELAVDDLDDLPPEPVHGNQNPFDAQGNYRHRSIYLLDIGDGAYVEMDFDEFDQYVDRCLLDVNTGSRKPRQRSKRSATQDVKPADAVKSEDIPFDEVDGDPVPNTRASDIIVRGNALDLNELRPYFLWQPTDIIRKTIEHTTQYGRITPDPLPYKVRYRTPYPAANVARRSEAVSADAVYSDTPAIDGGETIAIIYFGLDSHLTTAHGIKNDDQFVNTLEDEIRHRGAMDKLITDSSVIETSQRVKDILRSLVISDWQSKPYHEHQNPVERRYQTVKRHVNQVMNFTGAPAYTWLLALLYVLYVLNRTACEAIHDAVPLTKSTGQTTDTSILFQFQFWEPVYYATDKKLSYSSKPGFPSDPGEKSGRFVGFAETVGDVFTYKILTDDTHKVIYRSEVRSAKMGSNQNLRVRPDLVEGESNPDSSKISSASETPEEFLKSPNRIPFGDSRIVFDQNNEPIGSHFKTFYPDELLHRSYLTPIDEKGQRFRARILEKVFEPDVDKGTSIQETPENVKFLITYDHPDRDDELIAYNEVLDHVEREIEASQDPDTVVWRFTEIVAHEGPLHTTDPSYKGSGYNVKVLWSDGTTTYEPLSVIANDDPVTCALYAQKHGLLEEPGWRRFKRIVKNQKKLRRMVNQSKLKSKRNSKRYKFGFEVPRNLADAIRLDKENKNTRWKDAMALELSQIMEYKTFLDRGYGDKRPPGYKRIRAHWVFDVKHDGRHKARLVAGGHLTDTPVETVYSGVVSLRSLRLVIFIAELNQLDSWGADIGNAYLEAETQEKVYIIGDAGFGNLEGHTLIIYKALYGLNLMINILNM